MLNFHYIIDALNITISIKYSNQGGETFLPFATSQIDCLSILPEKINGIENRPLQIPHAISNIFKYKSDGSIGDVWRFIINGNNACSQCIDILQKYNPNDLITNIPAYERGIILDIQELYWPLLLQGPEVNNNFSSNILNRDKVAEILRDPDPANEKLDRGISLIDKKMELLCNIYGEYADTETTIVLKSIENVRMKSILEQFGM